MRALFMNFHTKQLDNTFSNYYNLNNVHILSFPVMGTTNIISTTRYDNTDPYPLIFLNNTIQNIIYSHGYDKCYLQRLLSDENIINISGNETGYYLIKK